MDLCLMSNNYSINNGKSTTHAHYIYKCGSIQAEEDPNYTTMIEML
jgi:translation elongation factor EF-1alpha